MKKQYKEWMIVAAAALGVMALSVGVTYIATSIEPAADGDDRNLIQRALNINPPEEVVPSEIPLHAAYAICREHIRNYVGPELQTMDFDNRATRHMAEDQFYQIFVNVHFANSRESVYSRCNVSSIDGTIEEYRLRSDEGFMFNLF